MKYKITFGVLILVIGIAIGWSSHNILNYLNTTFKNEWTPKTNTDIILQGKVNQYFTAIREGGMAYHSFSLASV